MPLLWRYLLRNFLQVFALSISSFVAILLVTRFQSIARFAASGASISLILKFITVQIPHILPLAVPISCLIAAFVLFQRISQSHEITALRGAGIGFAPLFFPLILCGIVIALANFTIVSEISPRCRSYSKNLAHQITLMNPLCLLQKGSLIKLKNAYIDIKHLKSGKYAEDVCLIMRNTSNQRLGLMMARKLTLEEDQLFGEGVAFISSIDSKSPEIFDHLIIENQAQMQTKARHLSEYLINRNWNFNYDYLNLRMLQAKHTIERGGLSYAPTRAIQEVARRISFALASLAFTFVGMICGLEIGRGQKWRGALWAIALMALYLITLVSAKSLKHNLLPSLGLFIFPFPILGFFCYQTLKKISRGVSE